MSKLHKNALKTNKFDIFNVKMKSLIEIGTIQRLSPLWKKLQSHAKIELKMSQISFKNSQKGDLRILLQGWDSNPGVVVTIIKA